MKELYEDLEMEIIIFEAEDIIATSDLRALIGGTYDDGSEIE